MLAMITKEIWYLPRQHTPPEVEGHDLLCPCLHRLQLHFRSYCLMQGNRRLLLSCHLVVHLIVLVHLLCRVLIILEEVRAVVYLLVIVLEVASRTSQSAVLAKHMKIHLQVLGNRSYL